MKKLSRKSLLLKALILFFALILLDQITKIFFAGEYGSLNQGISFGISFSLPPLVMQFSLLGLLIIVTWLVFRVIKASLEVKVFLLAGAYSNLLDRFLFAGYVRDWLFIPGTNLTNNLADWFIFISIILFLFENVLRYRIWK